MKQIKRTSVLIAVLTVGSLIFWWNWPQPIPSEAAANRITKGMTDKQVLAIIKVPPGDYTPLDWNEGKPLVFYAVTAYEREAMERHLEYNHEPRISRPDLGWVALNWISD